MNEISTEANTANPNDYGAKNCHYNVQEIGGYNKDKSAEDARGWKEELMNFKAEAEEFIAEFEKSMERRTQYINGDESHISENTINLGAS